MKISEFVDKLNQIKNLHGDVEVWTSHEWSDIVLEINFEDESINDSFKEYWPPRVDIRGGGDYDFEGEYKKRK